MDDSAFRHMERLLRDETAGDFQIERMLGRGGMAVVYLARDIHLDRNVAIKVLPPELTFGHGVERFKREAKTAAALDHASIIPIYRIASGGTLFWYAMKYLDGESLEDILKRRTRLNADETIALLAQVADALDYAHERRVIHRDIKPANVMVDDRGRATVTDFGIAKALTEGTLTASGSVIGTPYFMSPEQGMGKPVTGASDQYSVAVMAYRMLSGQVPFEGDSAVDILHKHCMIAPPMLHGIAPGLPGNVYRAIHKALEKKAEHRFSSVTAFVGALRGETRELTGYSIDISAAPTVMAAGPPRFAPAPPTPDSGISRISTEVIETGAGAARRGGRKALMAAGLIVLLGGAGALWQLTRSPLREPPQQGAMRSDSGAERTTAKPTTTDRTGGAAANHPAGQPAPAPAKTDTVSAPAAPSTGTIRVTGLPTGARIVAEGQVRTSPFALSPGRHQIRITAPEYESLTTAVDVTAGAEIVVAYTGRRVARQSTPPVSRPQQAVIDSATIIVTAILPPADNVFINGTPMGERSRFRETVRAGVPILLRFVKAGYEPYETTITLEPKETRRLRVELKPLP